MNEQQCMPRPMTDIEFYSEMKTAFKTSDEAASIRAIKRFRKVVRVEQANEIADFLTTTIKPVDQEG